MTRRRWIADRVEGDRAFLLGSNANHLFRVLRVKIGQEFDVAANGVLRFAKVVFASHDEVEFDLGAEVESAALPQVTVYLSIFKFDRLEWALEKLTELGVSQVVPMVAQRTEEHLAKAAAKRVERWRKIAREASQQARRIAPPEIAEPATLKKAIAEAQGSRIVLSEAEDRISLKSALLPAPFRWHWHLVLKADGRILNWSFFGHPNGRPLRWAIRSCAQKPHPLRLLPWRWRSSFKKVG